MKYIQSFNESIVGDKILYLRDLCNNFFDDYDDFEFKIVNGERVHSHQSIITDYFVGNRQVKLLHHNYPEKYIFLFVRKVDNLTLGDPEAIEAIDYLVLNQFEDYLEKIGFLSRGYTTYYGGRLYRFDKHSKMTQKYI